MPKIILMTGIYAWQKIHKKSKSHHPICSSTLKPGPHDEFTLVPISSPVISNSFLDNFRQIF